MYAVLLTFPLPLLWGLALLLVLLSPRHFLLALAGGLAAVLALLWSLVLGASLEALTLPLLALAALSLFLTGGRRGDGP